MNWKPIWIGLAIVGLGWLITISVIHANPFTCDDSANTCTYLATASEPTKTTSGAALTNYKQTNLKTSVNGGAVMTTVKAATALTGGGTVTQNFSFATTPCAVTTFTTKASGTNTLNLEGPDTAPVTVTRDRTLDPTCAPAAPGLTVN
jgi:hypothetical protein